MRLDRFLADAGLGSRREVRELIRSGVVTVDGAAVRDPGAAVDPGRSEVAVGGRRVAAAPGSWIALHKPAGVVTATVDARHATVLDLLPPEMRHRDLRPVGRLDRDTTGLLLLTTDGQLLHRLTAPRRHVEKEYLVRLDGPVGEADVAAFAAGVVLGDGTRCRPAALHVDGDGTVARVVIHEGRYHQVKRMFAARGRRVLSLTRVRFGPLLLDPRLSPGSWRPLEGREIQALYALVDLQPPALPA